MMVMLGVGFIIEQPPQHKGASAELPWGLEPTGTLRLQEFCACDWLATNLRMLGGRDKIAASRGVRSCPLVGIWQYGCFGGDFQLALKDESACSLDGNNLSLYSTTSYYFFRVLLSETH